MKITRFETFSILDQIDLAIDTVNHNLQMILLEVTEKCNLRCGYCVYNELFTEKRNHYEFDMPLKTGLKAIDYLKNHSDKTEKISIGFYGGEPLLNFNLIKNIVNYAKDQIKKGLLFTITTNGTMINKEIASYLSSEDFSVLVSLDGPEEIHDLWRKDKLNRGSFKKTLKGLVQLSEVYKNKLSKLSLSMVYAPPYYKDKLEKIADFISNNECIPDNIRVTITYPEVGSVPGIFSYMKGESNFSDCSLAKWMADSYYKNFEKNKAQNPLAKPMEKSLATLLKRPLYDYPMKWIPMNGCCIPGERKLFFTARGDIEICERVKSAPKLGNIEDGLNKEVLIKKYIEEYSKKSLSDCSKCWMARLCSICYQHAFMNGEINLEMKKYYCKLNELSLLEDMKFYCYLREKNVGGLNYLYDYKLS